MVSTFLQLFAFDGPYRGFALGASLMASATIGLFFLSYWRETKDRLFLFFSAAFFVFGVERCLLVENFDGFSDPSSIYLTRVVGFMLIGLAIIDKNRQHRSK